MKAMFKTAALGLMTAVSMSFAAHAEEAPAPLTDDQITSIVLTVSQNQINVSKLAADHASNTLVKEFATKMITDQTKNIETTQKLMTDLNLKAVDHPINVEARKRGEVDMADLSKLSGAEFDKAFAAREVQCHEDGLKLLDEKLIPAAKNDKVKSFLTDVRASVDAHLKLAQALRDAVK